MSPGHPVPSTIWHVFGPNVYIPFTQTRWPQEGHNRRAQQNPRQDVHKNPTKPKTRCPQETIWLPQMTQMTTDDNQWTQPYSLRMAGTRRPLSFEYFCILVPLRDSTDNFTILILVPFARISWYFINDMTWKLWPQICLKEQQSNEKIWKCCWNEQ